MGAWPRICARLRAEHGAAFADLFGSARTGDLDLTLLLDLDDGSWLALRDMLRPGDEFPTITDVFAAAGWYEREVFERFGVAAIGNPQLTPLGMVPESGQPGTLEEITPLGPAPAEVVDYPLGPVRSGITESAHFTFRTVGEEILDLRLQLGYKHRDVEELAAGLPPTLVPVLAERVSGTDAVAIGLATCQALEQLAGVVVPARAQSLRSIAGELERLHNHAGYQADLAGATGLVVGQAQLEILRERLLRLNARVSGHRYLFGLVVPGGVAVDPSEALLRDLVGTVSELRGLMSGLGELLGRSGSHMDRLRTTGTLDRSLAQALGVPGPVGRASGHDVDARRDHPYAAYAESGVAVPLREAGDAAARMAVRLDESAAAANLILDLVDGLPGGPVVSVDRLGPIALGPDRVGLGWAEGSRGAEIVWIETDGNATIRRYRLRSASFAGWQAFARCVPGSNILTDFPIIEQSFGLSVAGADR